MKLNFKHHRAATGRKGAKNFMGAVALGILVGMAASLVAQTASQKPVASKVSAAKPVTDDLNDKKGLQLGVSIPLDDGRGYPSKYGFWHWNRKGWPSPSTDFRLIFGGVAADAELTMRSLISENTDLGVGLNYQLLGRFEEYERGQINIGNRMETLQGSGRLFIHHHLVMNYVEVAQIRATYEAGYTDYSRDDDTAANFTLAPDGWTQVLKLVAGTGKITSSNYQPRGWEVNLGGEAAFREDWRRWGPPNLWDSPSEFQKFNLDATFVAVPCKEQSLVMKFNGGLGSNLDRLSAWKLGGSLTGLPKPLALHGFYMKEIRAEDFALVNLEYIIPILKEQELAMHLYGDGAVTRRSDIPDRSAHAWAGTGAAFSVKGGWGAEWLVGYGYGINAQRGADHGGHEIFIQMSRSF